MRTKFASCAFFVTTTIVLTACGGGGGSDSGASSTAAPAPAAAGTNTGATTGTTTGTNTGANNGSGAASGPTAVSGGGTTGGGTTGTVSTGSVPTVASLPAGLQSGGTAVKTSSGYSDALLTGRWRSADAGSECFDLPAILGCTNALSFSSALGYSASGNAATRIIEVRYFRGAGCQAANLSSNFRSAEDIAFEAADTNVSDTTPGVAAGAQVAVRRGVVTAERFEVGDQSALTSLFAGCPSVTPSANPPPPPAATTCARETVQLRIEQSATATPVLLVEDFTNCQPGAVAPANPFRTFWNMRQSSGDVKLP